MHQRTQFALIALCTLAACGGEDAGPNTDQEVELNAVTRIPEDDPNYVSTEVQDGRLVITYSRPADQVDIQPGYVVVGTAGSDGYLRRVTSVTTDGNQLIAETAAASLTDAITRGSFSETIDLSDSANTTVNSPLEGTLLSAGIDLSGRVLFQQEISGVNVVVRIDKGSISFSPELNIDGDVSFGSIDRFEAIGRGVLVADLDVTAEVSDSFSLSREVDINGPLPLLSQTITFFIGPVPVVATVELDVFAGFDLNASAQGSVTTGIDFFGEVEVGGVFEDGQLFGIFDPSLDVDLGDVVINTNANASVKAHLRPRVQLKVFGVPGPAFDVVTSVKGDFKFLPPPVSAKVVAGVTGSLSFNLTVLSEELINFNRQLFEFTATLFDGPLF